VFVNNQHGIQREKQDFDKKKFVFEGVHSKEGRQVNFVRKAGQSVVLISG